MSSEPLAKVGGCWTAVFTSSAASCHEACVRSPPRPARAPAGLRGRPRREAADVETVAADPASYFSEQRQREADELGHANILITGQTGVGKSTLVNAIFRAELAKEGVGRPVTQRVQRHDAPGVPVTIFDTPGIELGDAKDAVIADFKSTVAASRRDAAENFIHLAWYCVDAGQTRIQGYDIDVITALADEVPVILVLTQCVDEDRVSALEAAIAAEDLAIQGVPVRTLAKARRIGEQTIDPMGLEELVRRTEQILPKAVKGAFRERPGCSHRSQGQVRPSRRHRVGGRRRRCRGRADTGVRRDRPDARCSSACSLVSPPCSGSR